ncbi:MAG TPA: 3-hydroxyacyl-CoA dehydrogenase NAD-binding domain-containing protein, partial [Paracoccaceae bacterium]|nr:3-hydroxyacyl-CoA dehydrogenase NAD-binding domain-containing protein [Paracoccaceae bacterium]
ANVAKVGLPEVKLGIFPGWGGTIRLPRLIGLDNALEWVATGNEQNAHDALAQGAVDAVVEADQLQQAALQILHQCGDGSFDFQARREEKRSPVRLNEIERSMVLNVARSMIAQKAGTHYPAPMIALECIERHVTMDRDDAVAIEVAGFVKAARTGTAANLVSIFLNDQLMKRSLKAYAKAARPIKHAAVLGAGIMGGGIAYQTALRGKSITMKDIKSEQLDLGLDEAKKLLIKRIDRGRMTIAQMADTLSRIQPTLTYGDVTRADIVVEAVVENRKIKQKVLKEIEDAVADEAVIASNTSTISITELGQSLDRPHRFCGMHFFNPVPIMPLVEVIRGNKTDDATVATTVEFARTMGKNPIVVNDCPGFLVNRILFPYLNAFNALVRDGADFRRIDKVMEAFGWPMGPAYLLDVVGIDTACHASSVLAAGYPDRMKVDYKTVT